MTQKTFITWLAQYESLVRDMKFDEAMNGCNCLLNGVQVAQKRNISVVHFGNCKIMPKPSFENSTIIGFYRGFI